MSRGLIAALVITAWALGWFGISLLVGYTAGVIWQWVLFPFIVAGGLWLGLRLGKWAAS